MRVTTVSLLCPLSKAVAEVTALCDEEGLVTVFGCTLGEPGTACLAPCLAEVRRWCKQAVRSAFREDPW